LDPIVTISPKVSICVPVFNGEAYIRQAIESVARQTYGDFELLMVDNSSTDATIAIATEISDRLDLKIRLYKNDTNLGLAANLNRCIDLAKGKYIKFLLVDDYLLPHCLELMVQELDNHPSVSLICGSRLSFDMRSVVFGEREFSPSRGVFSGLGVITRCLYSGNSVGEPTAVMFRRADVISRFRVDLPQLMDLAFWFHLLERGDLFNIPEPVCAIRAHDAQATVANVKSGKLIDDNILLFDEFSRKAYIVGSSSSLLRHRLLMTYRVWVSRGALAEPRKKFVLARYGLSSLYFLMPLVSLFLTNNRKYATKRSISAYLGTH